jgi:hypothetical protein
MQVIAIIIHVYTTRPLPENRESLHFATKLDTNKKL